MRLGQNLSLIHILDGAFSSSFAMPMSYQGLVTGAVYLLEHDAQRGAIILSVQGRVRAVSLVIGAAALVLAGFFAFIIMQRLRELVQSMRIVAGGDYSYRHVTRGRDEISELGNEFNQLTERLQTTERQRRRFVSDASHELKTLSLIHI